MSINKLILPNSVNTIKDYAFKNSTNLSKVVVGGGVNTTIASAIAALTNKKITLGNYIFNGISKIHSAHSFSYTVTKAATCTATGSKTGTCTCGNTDIQTIAATGHSYGSWVISSNETTKTRTCSKCGNKETAAVTKVELRNADSATKSKYNFKCTGNNVQYVECEGSCTTKGGADFYNIFENITPSSCPVGSIAYINSTDKDINAVNRSIMYAINESNTTIPAGYYKIKAICNRSETLYNSVRYNSGACNLIPFAMGSAGGYYGGYGESSSSTIKTELSKYIEYLGNSYKVVPA